MAKKKPTSSLSVAIELYLSPTQEKEKTLSDYAPLNAIDIPQPNPSQHEFSPARAKSAPIAIPYPWTIRGNNTPENYTYQDEVYVGSPNSAPGLSWRHELRSVKQSFKELLGDNSPFRQPTQNNELPINIDNLGLSDDEPPIMGALEEEQDALN